MTKIAEIYDAIVEKMRTSLPRFSRLPNPYALEENPAIMMRRAYGISIGAGSNTERYVGCIATWQRDYIIGLLAQVVSTEVDTDGRVIMEKEIIDAHRALLLAFETDSTLSGKCIKALIADDGGITYLQGESGKYLAVEITLRVEYQESTV